MQRAELFAEFGKIIAQIDVLKSVVQNPPTVSVTEEVEEKWDHRVDVAIGELRALKSEVSEYLCHHLYRFKTAHRIIPKIQQLLLSQDDLPGGITFITVEEAEFQEAIFSTTPEVAEEATFCLRKKHLDQELANRYSYLICLNGYQDGGSSISVHSVGDVVSHKDWSYQFYKC